MKTPTWILAAWCATGCGSSNPLHEIAQGISAAATTARSATLALGAIAGKSASCVAVTGPCTSYPCSASVTVQVGGTCAMPLAAADSGVITVKGTWSSATQASLSLTLVDVKAAASAEAIALTQVTQVAGSLSGDSATVTFSASNATARSGVDQVAVGGADTWTANVTGLSTDDPADDVFHIQATAAGGGAGVGVSAKVTTLDGVVVDPSCTRNPIAGTGNITEVSGFIPSIKNIAFHAACDGKGTINGTSYDFTITP